jgi:RNA polymerase sigma-70 factor (ECF subfamily)
MRRDRTARVRWFEDTILPHAEAVYRTAYHLAGPQEAEDLTQETFLKAYQAFDQFRGPDPKPWLFAILRHVFVDQCRRRRHENPIVAIDETTPHRVRRELCGPSAEEQVLGGLMDGDVQEALCSLPSEWRLMLLLADVEDLSYKEIADVMQIPIGTVMSRLCRARKRLRAHLCDQARHAGYAEEQLS